MWLTVAAVVVGGATAVALVWPNTAPKSPAASNVPLHIDNTPLKPVRLKVQDSARALAVASRFIYTAVARKNIDRSWDLAAQELRAGLTRKQWDTGNNPVVPYPVREARWKLEYSDVEGVGFSIALFPTKVSHQRPQVFLIGLHALRSGKHRRWVVDNWQPAPSRGLRAASVDGGGTVLDQVTPKASGSLSRPKESATWLLLPVGLLSLIVLLPLGIATVNWYRDHRARALLDL